jgi:hypothetical protein
MISGNFMMLRKLTSVSEFQLQKLITILGMLITCQVIYIQHGWINDDSVLYFEVARLFSIGEWKQGVMLFNWPLYPALISVTHQLTQLSLQESAQLLNVVFFGITTYSFISLIRLAGGNKTTIACGAFLLLSSPYIVGDVLPMLLRDQGFWAMFLSSLVFLIRFYRQKKLSDSLLWQICAIFAVLFRIEAITFLICLPFVLFQQHELSVKQKIIYFLKLNLISLFAFMLIIGALIFVPTVHLSDFGRLQEAVTIFPRMLTDVAQIFATKTKIMEAQVLGGSLDGYGLIGIMITLVSIVTLKMIGVVSWPVMGVFALSHANSKLESKHSATVSIYTVAPDARVIFHWVLALALLNACVIISSVFVLPGRYIIAFGLIVLIFAAFHLASLLEKVRTKSIGKCWHHALVLVLIILIAFIAINNILPKKAGYTYEQEAVAFVKQQGIANSKVFYVTPRSRYFAGAAFTERGIDPWDITQKAIADGSIYKYDYLVIYLDIDDQILIKQAILSEKLAQYAVSREFYGYLNKKKMVIYIKKSVD